MDDSGGASNTGDNYMANDDGVQPIELLVQSLLQTPLENLDLNIKSLKESQMILKMILCKMESTLIETSNNLKPNDVYKNEEIKCDTNSSVDGHEECVIISKSNKDVTLNDYIQQMDRIRSKLKKIQQILDVVESRVSKIEHNIGI